MCKRLECLENVPEREPPNFIWGNEVPGDVFCDRVDKANEEVIHWQKNIFILPFGKASKAFIQEVADLLQAFAQKNSYEGVALSLLSHANSPFAEAFC